MSFEFANQIFFIVGLALCVGTTHALAVPRCENVFSDVEEGPHYDAVLDLALSKVFISQNGNLRGVSPKDLDLFVNKVFNKEEGKVHNLSDYWKKSAEDRTLRTIEREAAKEITKKGVLRYLQEKGFAVDKSRWMTRFNIIYNSRTLNVIGALWTAVSMTRGGFPILLPEGNFKIKPEDLGTLILKGFDSPEGQALVKNITCAWRPIELMDFSVSTMLAWHC